MLNIPFKWEGEKERQAKIERCLICDYGKNLWKGLSDEIICVQFSFCFLRLQFYFSNYVIVSCELPYYNSFGQRMLLKN